MTKFSFFTYCTADYLPYAINSIQSALRFSPNSNGKIICVDALPERYPVKTAKINIQQLSNFPRVNKIFTESTEIKSKLESLISIKPSLMLELVGSLSYSEVLVYLDTDIYFFSALEPFAQQNVDADFIAAQHLYPVEPSEYPYGKYNAGLIMMRKSENTLQILREWERLCLSWCLLVRSEGRYADQGYLEELLKMRGAKGVKSTVVNIGMHYLLKGPKVTKSKKSVLIADKKLIAFHFHGFKVNGNLIWTGLNRYGFSLRNFKIYRIIYRPFIQDTIKNMLYLNELKRERLCNKFMFPNVILWARFVRRTNVRVPFRLHR